MSRVLITGGSGFIGTNLVDHYLRLGHTVCTIDVVPPKIPEHVPHYRAVSVRDLRAITQTIAAFSPEIVFHLGARTDLRGRSLTDYADNVDGVANVVKVLNSIASVKRVVFASSMLVCRLGYVPAADDDYCPTTVYGQSKADGEKLIRRFASTTLPWLIVRPTSIWGPWFGPPYRDLFDAIRRGLYFQPKGIRVSRSYGFVLNSVHQLQKLAECSGNTLLGRTIYLADEHAIELGEWIRLIQLALGKRPMREAPLALFRAAALFGDALQAIGISGFPMASQRLSNMLTEALYDTRPIHSVAGPDPYSVEDGVRLTCEWLADQRLAS